MNKQKLSWLGTAAGLAMSACAQAPAKPGTTATAATDIGAWVQNYVDREVVPFWQGQKAFLAATIKSSPTPQYRSIWQELDTAERNLPTKDLLAATMQGDTPQERAARMIWLRARILNGNADSRYSYTYAYLLSITSEPGQTKPMMKEAATFLLQGRLALLLDGARCQDRASPQIARRSLELMPHLAPIMDYLNTGPVSEIADALANARAIEQSSAGRPSQHWLCGLGAGTALKALSGGAAPVVSKDGQSITIDTSGMTPDHVADEVWQQRKRAVFDEQMQAIVNRTR